MRWLEFFLIKIERLVQKKDPVRVLSIGYLSYMVIGFFALCLPIAVTTSVPILDRFFIAVSAVSTTGLATIDPGSSFSFFGELVILFLIQLGGIGYMTFGSFIILQTGHRISAAREKMTRAAFPLPEALDVKVFLRSVILFTIAVEFLGAVALSLIFWSEGIENPVWSGVFHSISAFCTAGFSLNSNSFESMSENFGLNFVISGLSILGAVGFIVMLDLWRRTRRQTDRLLFTSKVILGVTSISLVVGTVILFFAEPSIQEATVFNRIQLAFFQAMTAATTVGFNTVPIGKLTAAVIMLMYFLMLFGASPSGTGGGLKSTTLTALIALVRSTLKRRKRIVFFNNEVPLKRIQYAAASISFCMFIIGLAVFILTLTESAPTDQIVFEAISALGTVGLSMGITGDLTSVGKWVIIFLMATGRIGVLSLGLSLSTLDQSALENTKEDLIL